MAYIARTPAEVVAGEAVSGTPAERWHDMVAIASSMIARANELGVPIDSVVAAPGQYNAYGVAMPPGTDSLIGMAQQAIDAVTKYGPASASTFYSTPSTQDNLPPGLAYNSETTGHVFKTDPFNRGLITTQGTLTPDPSQLGILSSFATPTAVTPMALDPAFTPSGLLAGAPTDTLNPLGVTPTAENVAGLSLGATATVPSTLGNVPANAGLMASLATPADARVTGLVDNASPIDRMGGVLSGFRDLASAVPVQSPMAVTASADQMRHPNLAAQASVPMTAGWFSPGLTADQQQIAQAAAMQKTPTVNNFGLLAAAQPVQSPMSVQATGVLGNPSNLSAATAAVPAQRIDVPASASLAGVPGLAASTVANPMLSVNAAGNLGQPPNLAANAVATPDMSVTPSLLSPQSLTNVSNQITSISPNTSLYSPAITPNLPQNQSFVPSDIANPPQDIAAGYQQLANTAMPGGLLNLGGTTTVNQDGTLKSTLAAPVSVPSTTTNSALSQATQSYQSWADAQNAVNQFNAPAPALNTGVLTAPAQLQSALTPSIAAPTSIPSIAAAGVLSQPVNVAKDPALSVPGLQTVSVPDQPTIAAPTETTTMPAVTVNGPATTPVTQQQQTPTTTTAAKTAPHSMFNAGTLTGGILGSVALGPVGGILGSLIGNQVNKAGGLTGLLGGQAPAMHEIPGGMANIASIYGGAMPVGTTAVTSTGGFVTAMPNGMTAYTNPFGVTNTYDTAGHQYGYFGPSLTGDHSVNNGQPGGGGGVGAGSSLF